MEIFGVSKFVSVPIAAVLVWLLIVKGSYRIVERVFLVACVIYLAYPLAALFADVPWLQVAKASVTPTFKADGEYVAMTEAAGPERMDWTGTARDTPSGMESASGGEAKPRRRAALRAESAGDSLK